MLVGLFLQTLRDTVRPNTFLMFLYRDMIVTFEFNPASIWMLLKSIQKNFRSEKKFSHKIAIVIFFRLITFRHHAMVHCEEKKKSQKLASVLKVIHALGWLSKVDVVSEVLVRVCPWPVLF